MMNKRSTLALKNILDESAELICLESLDEKYYLVNILKVIDAIDYENSTLEKLSSGFVIGIEKYVFKEEFLQGQHLFKTLLDDTIMATDVFVSDKFKSTVEEAGLVGFKFTEVWNGDN